MAQIVLEVSEVSGYYEHSEQEAIPMELWKQIPEWSEYEVSNCGRVRRAIGGRGTRVGRILRAVLYNNGYLFLSLRSKPRSGNFSVHRLVASAFIGPCPEGMEVRHLDGNRFNNRADNIAYGTKSENGRDRITHGTAAKGARNHLAKLCDASVQHMRFLRSRGSKIKGLSHWFGVNQSVTSKALRGITWAHIPLTN